MSKNSFSLGNLYFFVFGFVPFGLFGGVCCFGPFEEFVPFGFLEEFVFVVLLRSLFLLVFWKSLVRFWSFSGVCSLLVFLEEFVPFLVLLRIFGPFEVLLVFFGLFGPFEEFVPFGLLEEFGCFGPFEEFVPFGLLERVWSSWSFVSEFAPVPSSVFSTSHEQRLLVEMKLILLKLKL
nr:hypothetical protein [Mycoplasmopsis bovis]